jgi:glycosyltransferase involved in cell wall biosynthesis
MSGLEPLRVGLDVTPVVTVQSGLGRYSAELWRALADRDDVTVSAFALGRGRAELELPVRRIPVPLRLVRPLWRHFRWPRAEFFTGAVDLVHSLALSPAPTRRPRVQTIHDLLALTRPDLYPPISKQVARDELAAASRADVVVTTCRATAEEISDFTGIPPDRIAVAPPGAFLSRLDAACSPSNGSYLLAVGQVTPRKGLDVLAGAADILGERCPPILVAGPDWWRSEEVRADIARLDTARRITLLGRVDDERLAALYRGATIVCHASRAEGFGMTCLEAMTAGVPLVASDLPSVRELTGGSAVLFPVEDAHALAGALESLLEDDQRRQMLAEAGRKRAQLFTWPRMAADVVGAYHRALA